MLSAAVAVALALGRESISTGLRKWLHVGYLWIVSAVFAYTLSANVVRTHRCDYRWHIYFDACFISCDRLHCLSSTGMRVADVTFVDDSSARLWDSLTGKKVNLVPPSRQRYPRIAEALMHTIENSFKVEGPIAFLHVHLLDNRSEFLSSLRVRVRSEGNNSVIEVWGAVCNANSIAYLSELLDPTNIVLGLTRRNLMQQSLASRFGERANRLNRLFNSGDIGSLQSGNQGYHGFCSSANRDQWDEPRHCAELASRRNRSETRSLLSVSPSARFPI